MELASIDIIVDDVEGTGKLLRDAFGFREEVIEHGFAQLTAGSMVVMLSRTAMVPMGLAAGIILHLRVDDPSAAAERAMTHGVETVHPPTYTDWGTYSILLQGPEGIIIDFYKEVQQM